MTATCRGKQAASQVEEEEEEECATPEPESEL